MADRIRLGIVGATVTPGGSGWGANAHVPALKALPDYELKAVCTAHDETARASQEAFGAELAFSDINAMVAHPDIDLVAVVVRVPWHRDLVLAAERAGKNVFCEWPLGANLAEAEEMASVARENHVSTIIGLQARSDPAIMFARELVQQGYVGEVLTVNLSVIGAAQIERGPGRIWQGERAAGANPLTIAGGHAIDALCHVLGEITDVSARVSTKVTEWKHADTGAPYHVDAPDNILVVGRLASGADVSIQVSTLPSVPPDLAGSRMEIYGSEGVLVVSAGAGPRKVFGAKGRDALAEMPTPDRFVLVPEGTPAGAAYNVAQAYARYADAIRSRGGFDPDFDLAVTRHRLLDAIERSSKEGRAISL